MGLGIGSTARMADGTLPNYLQPTQGKNLYGGNYLNFLDGSIDQWAQQFLPDVYDKEIEIYGNRTISGFLKMVSAEMPSTSDQIIWLEQGRLHTRYADITLTHGTSPTAAGSSTTALTATTSRGVYVTGVIGLQGRPEDTTSTTEGIQIRNAADTANVQVCNFRVGQTVMVGTDSGVTIKGVVTFVGTGDASNTFIFQIYKGRVIPAGDFGASGGGATALVYGNEFAKGTGNFTEKLDPSYSTYSNAPIIMKEHYAINGSDTSQIGWIEVTSENGANGYLWYVKAEHENRLRWEDYLEMAMVEGVENDAPTAANLNAYRSDFAAATNPVGYNRGNTNLGARGTQGFFDALEERGNVYENLAADLRADAADTTAGASPTTSFDLILTQMDKQGAIEENMLYVDRALSLAFTDHLASVNSNANATGTSYGLFNNSEAMALKLHFNGFRRGSYDFYQTDWKYLNDFSTRGGFNDIQGVLIPAGTSTVYDQNLGKNIKRPFLHIRYRSSETDNRKMKSWITGSVGGAYTTDIDEMRMHYLTERCLITQGANNFFLLAG